MLQFFNHLSVPLLDLLQFTHVSLVIVRPELGTLLAHVQLFRWDLQVLFCKSAFQLVDTQPVLVHGVIPPQVQDLALPFELHVVPVDPSCQQFSEWQHIYLVYQPLLLILYHLQTC